MVSKSIYLTGYTVYSQKIIDPLGNKKIDFVNPNMGAAKKGSLIMTLTLDSKMLKKLINNLKINRIIPVHYGTFEHYVESKVSLQNLSTKILLIDTGKSIRMN